MRPPYGIREGIFSALAGAEDAPERLFIDSSCIRIHRCAAEEKGALAHGTGCTKGGRNTKLHAACDAKDRPVVLLLTPGEAHDVQGFGPLFRTIADKVKALLADL